jgi:hypothetical protein
VVDIKFLPTVIYYVKKRKGLASDKRNRCRARTGAKEHYQWIFFMISVYILLGDSGEVAVSPGLHISPDSLPVKR